MLAVCEAENWGKTLSLVEYSLRQGLEFGFSKSELERVRKRVLLSLQRNIAEFETTESGDLASAIIATINRDKVFMAPEDEYRLIAPYLRSLTPEAVHEEFRTMWGDDHRLVMIAGNTGMEAEAGEKALESAWNASRKRPVSPKSEKEDAPYRIWSKRKQRKSPSRRTGFRISTSRLSCSERHPAPCEEDPL